ncbi:MAG: arginine--tRNA ligase [Pseudomonadales bacterium]|nr:arginine--tRNA ligase [Pseudomonadales bacterium]
MNIKEYLSKQVRQAMNEAGLPLGSDVLLTQSTRPEFGHYQANGALPAAKKMKTNPRELAEAIVKQLNLENIAEKIEIAGPGFINIFLAPDWLASQCENAIKDSHLGVSRHSTPATVVVDYSAPNLAKEMHVGHLRGTIIGDAVVRVLEFMGDRVIRQNHMGDWGTQFGMLIAHLEDRLSAEQALAEVALDDLEAFYREAKVRFDDDPEFASRAREYVVKLQAGDTHCLRLWQKFIDISIKHSEAIYDKLKVTLLHAHIMPESAYNNDLPKLVAELRKQGLAITDQGAEVVFLDEFADKEGKPSPVIVQKSDGGYLYATSDLAALRYRNETLKADRVLYFVDARQSLHLQQVFTVARKAGWVRDEVSLEHLAFGTMMGEDGKPFKTRTGGTVKLAELLDEAVQRADRLVVEKNQGLSPEERQEIAKKVGIGAVKYADLSKHRTSDYMFNWDSMLSFEGNTAPYLQYAYTRIQSIFRKAGINGELPPGRITLNEEHEINLALKLLRFSETIEQVAAECTPHQLCSYLYELASLTMSFYENCPILKQDISPEIRTGRLRLCQLAARTLRTGLDLLGIDVMDKM